MAAGLQVSTTWTMTVIQLPVVTGIVVMSQNSKGRQGGRAIVVNGGAFYMATSFPTVDGASL